MPGDIGRYQIDYIMVKQRFRNQVKNSRSYPGADVDTDHNLVLMTCDLKFKKLLKKNSNKWRTDKLKQEDIRNLVEKRIYTKIERIGLSENDIEENWNIMKKAISYRRLRRRYYKHKKMRNGNPGSRTRSLI